MGERKATLHFMCPAGFIKRSAFTDIYLGQKALSNRCLFHLIGIVGFRGSCRRRRGTAPTAVLPGRRAHDPFERFPEGAFGFVPER
jgi:hypothetical protein